MSKNEPVDGKITRIEHFGLYVNTDEGEALVLIPDVSRKRVPRLDEAYSIGDLVRVRLLRFVADEGIYKATMILDE